MIMHGRKLTEVERCIDLENQVIELTRILGRTKGFPGVKRDYLGTLHTNLVFLRNRANELARALEDQYGFHASKCPEPAPTTQEYCIKHGNGTFTDTGYGLVCDECSRECARKRT